MRTNSIIFVLFLGSVYGCAASEPHSFRGHLIEAIALNEVRRSQYAEMAAGDPPKFGLSEQSVTVSNLLISVEKKGVLASYLPIWFWKGLNLDAAARIYQEAGVPIIHEDLVPLDGVPDIRLYRPPYPVLDDRYISTFDFARDDGDFADFATLGSMLEQEIEHLSIEPRFNCILRHGLESALRVANHAPVYIDLAAMQGLPSPEPLLWRLLESHFWVIDDAMEIDRRAAPLQAQGIPIICNDVPSIPPVSAKLLQIYERARTQL